MKVIAFYLPQYHQIPENDEWWGEGFTEWTNVKQGKKYYDWQCQPRIPLNNNYYDLSDSSVQEWQANLAKQYGIYGFCYYHYWFDGHLLLEKPMERMLENKNIDLPFCVCWANENWTNAWVSEDEKILISQTYGDKAEWKRHYQYLSPFFKDDRYIKLDGCPLVVIYRAEIIPCLSEMLAYWNELAKLDGFDRLIYAHQSAGLDFPQKKDDSSFDFDIEMQPSYAKIMNTGLGKTRIKSFLLKVLQKTGLDFVRVRRNKAKGPKIEDYDIIWQKILDTAPISEKSIPCAFVDFDNTCRRKEQGWLFKGCTVDKFKRYFGLLCQKARTEYKKDMMFIFAWNEWGEGGYLEPDSQNEHAFLQAIKDTLDTQN